MPLRPFRKQQTADRQLNRFQDNLETTVSTLRSGPFGSGNVVKGIVFSSAGTQLISHGLGSAYQGFLPVRYQVVANTVPSAVVEVSNPAALGIVVDKSKQILIGVANACVLDIWFF